MEILNYKKKLLEDIEYWNEVNKAKMPEERLINLVHPMTHNIEVLLSIEAYHFYAFGGWYYQFLGNVIVPICRVLYHFMIRHVNKLYKSLCMVCDSSQNQLSVLDTFLFLKSFPIEVAKDICLNLCDNKTDAAHLVSCIITNNAELFIDLFCNLRISAQAKVAMETSINLLRKYDFYITCFDFDKDVDDEVIRVFFKRFLADVSGIEDLESIPHTEDFNLYTSMCKALASLGNIKNETSFNYKFLDKYDYSIWLQLAFNSLSFAMIDVSFIWDALTTEEKNVLNGILNPENDLPLILNNERILSTQDIIERAGELRVEFCQDLNKMKKVEKDSDFCQDLQEPNQKEVYDTRHFDFPTRLINDVEPIGMNPDDRKKILADIYGLLPGSFVNSSVDDFIYLFGGSSVVPPTYRLPFIWDGKATHIKALFKILYEKNNPPIECNKLIITKTDSIKSIRQHKWSENKDAVKHEKLEEVIIEAVRKATGKSLQRLPPSKRNIKKEVSDSRGGAGEPE